MKHLIVFLMTVVASSLPVPCLAQSSWLDFSSAIPRVLNGDPSLNTQVPGFPSTSGFPSTTGAPASGAPITRSYDPSLPGASYGSSGFGNSASMYAPARKDWKLGVYVQNTDAGAVITQIAPGSAAQAAGLQPNDIIVAVSGARLGNFDNRIIEIADEIRKSTDAYGRVSLLVFNSRLRSLAALAVSMNSTSSTLTGVVATRDRVSLPPGSILNVELKNVSKPYYVIAGGKASSRAEGNGPFGFEINFDPRYIEPRDQYQLTASISVGNQIMYVLPQPIRVDVNNLGPALSLVLEQASGGLAFSNPNNSAGNPVNVVNVGYPASFGPAQLNELFMQVLNRPPSQREVVAWQEYLSQGNSPNDLKVKLISSSQFRERFGYNDAAYIDRMIQLLKNRPSNQQEVAYWITRLQQTGSAEQVANEILLKNP
ncbi:MAG: YbaY family lipoprotein [Planctomycetota bacterium]|nr:YbaY family lipoprotein [Planctomycetota bacterium]